MQTHYDYIITGAGCAGSSLLMRMLSAPFFQNRTILVIDQSHKTTDDHTWCFWEKEPDVFESVVKRQWRHVYFHTEQFSSRLDLAPYTYKMINSIDLYRFVREAAENSAQVKWITGTVTSVATENGMGKVTTTSGVFTSQYVFNSILFEQPLLAAGTYFMWQHFTGWVVRSATPVFDTHTATLMDFTVPQHDDTRFVYVLPEDAHTALVEYTVFSEQLLPDDDYTAAVRNYLSNTLGIEQYEIVKVEKGKIPMTNHRFPAWQGAVVHMGTAGGDVKPSSGYAFRFIQKRTGDLVNSMLETGHPFRYGRRNRFAWYDSTLLQILHKKKLPGAAIFSDIFSHNPPQRVLRFLDNETTIWQDLAIMRSVPTGVFLRAALQEIKQLI